MSSSPLGPGGTQQLDGPGGTEQIKCPPKIIKLDRLVPNHNLLPDAPPLPGASNEQLDKGALSSKLLSTMQQGGSLIDLNEKNEHLASMGIDVPKYINIPGGTLLGDNDLTVLKNKIINSIDHQCALKTKAMPPKIIGPGGTQPQDSSDEAPVSKSGGGKQKKSRRKTKSKQRKKTKKQRTYKKRKRNHKKRKRTYKKK